MEYAQRTPQCIVIILQYNITIVYITNLLLFPRVSCLIYSEKKMFFSVRRAWCGSKTQSHDNNNYFIIITRTWGIIWARDPILAAESDNFLFLQGGRKFVFPYTGIICKYTT